MEISLNKTASAFYISPFYLSKIFKDETGINYIEYVVQCKMEKATNLLASTDLSIEEVTNSIGYKHASYFTRKFKEFSGKTPNEYRIALHLKS
jgi:two-component system response regulator YesN